MALSTLSLLARASRCPLSRSRTLFVGEVLFRIMCTRVVPAVASVPQPLDDSWARKKIHLPSMPALDLLPTSRLSTFWLWFARPIDSIENASDINISKVFHLFTFVANAFTFFSKYCTPTREGYLLGCHENNCKYQSLIYEMHIYVFFYTKYPILMNSGRYLAKWGR